MNTRRVQQTYIHSRLVSIKRRNVYEIGLQLARSRFVKVGASRDPVGLTFRREVSWQILEQCFEVIPAVGGLFWSPARAYTAWVFLAEAVLAQVRRF